MTDITIPPEARKAALLEYMAHRGEILDPEALEAAIRAAIAAWPGMKQKPSWELRTHKRSVEIILPLQEARDDRR